MLQKGLFIIKPGFASKRRAIMADLKVEGINVIHHCRAPISTHFVDYFYADVMQREPEAREALRDYAIHYADRKMVIMLVEAEELLLLLPPIKMLIRSFYAEKPPHKTRNVIHISDTPEEIVNHSKALLHLKKTHRIELPLSSVEFLKAAISEWTMYRENRRQEMQGALSR